MLCFPTAFKATRWPFTAFLQACLLSSRLVRACVCVCVRACVQLLSRVQLRSHVRHCRLTSQALWLTTAHVESSTSARLVVLKQQYFFLHATILFTHYACETHTTDAQATVQSFKNMVFAIVTSVIGKFNVRMSPTSTFCFPAATLLLFCTALHLLCQSHTFYILAPTFTRPPALPAPAVRQVL